MTLKKNPALNMSFMLSIQLKISISCMAVKETFDSFCATSIARI